MAIASAASGTTIIGLLLAGGRGSRFSPDGSANKLLARLADGRPVCVAAAQAMRAALPRVVAATSPHSPEVAQALREAGCRIAVSDEARLGMGHTLAQAVALVAQVEQAAGNEPPAWCVMPADMPWVAADTLARLRDAWLALPPQRRADAVLAASYRDRRGHPVLFGPEWTPRLAALVGDEGARAIVAERVVLVPVPDPGCLRDVDTPSDLA